MKLTVKTNGYKAEELQDLIEAFNEAGKDLFGDGGEIVHFYYGDFLDMITVTTPGGGYGHFNLSKNRISFNGHCCDIGEYDKFTRMTYNDELFRGGVVK